MGTATLAFAVEVGAAGAIRPQDGTTTYTVNGQRVTVTQAPGTLAGIALTVTLPTEGASIEFAKPTAEGRVEDDDTEQARKRSLEMVLAGVGRTLATDAVDVIGDRFVRRQATVGGQALNLDRAPQRGRWRHAAGVAYGVARALGVEVGSPLGGRRRAVRAGTRGGLEHVDAAPAGSARSDNSPERPGTRRAPSPLRRGRDGEVHRLAGGHPALRAGPLQSPRPPSTSSGTTWRGLEPAPDLIRGTGPLRGKAWLTPRPSGAPISSAERAAGTGSATVAAGQRPAFPGTWRVTATVWAN